MEGTASPVTDSAERWRQTRRVLNANRQALAALAARLHGDGPRVASTDLLGRPDWIPAGPLDLADLALGWVAEPPPAADGSAPGAAHVLPRQAAGGTYPTYAAAIAALDRPALFENRVCYRLLDATLAGAPRLSLTRARYFDSMNLGHAVAHELAAAWTARGGSVSLADLPLRSSVADPCELRRRSAITAVTTLTLRRAPGGAASFLLHWRDPAKVNHAGGLYQVMPAGIFQPVTDAPAAQRSDLSLWRCMTREFSEELLGGSEDYPTRDGVLDYGQWPFYRQLAAAREAGTLRVSCLGLGVDPLTLATDILTVAVFDSDVFDQLFRDLVTLNAEGRVITEGGSAAIPFTVGTVDRLTSGSEPMQTAGAALLRLAWQHRRALLT
ncbi:MAG TPA: hypothetical protein VMV92_28035 [Streptosporangiaceae bacterium]|nr:hypothetical protein [Streptosporangiaceae bacterium]